MKLPATEIGTPVGELRIITREGKVCIAEWTDCWERAAPLLERRYGETELVSSKETKGAAHAMDAYFQGQLDAIDTLSVDAGGTPFQRSVWKKLRQIRAGSTVSYGHLAGTIGQPGASRAVGRANGSNPVAIIIPCHRVIRVGGRLGGYAGGLPRKEWLLQHEGALL